MSRRSLSRVLRNTEESERDAPLVPSQDGHTDFLRRPRPTGQEFERQKDYLERYNFGLQPDPPAQGASSGVSTFHTPSGEGAGDFFIRGESPSISRGNS